MIKINLTAAKKQVDISNLGGFDFTQLKIKAVIIACVVIYLPDFFIQPIWEDEYNVRTQEFSTLQGQ